MKKKQTIWQIEDKQEFYDNLEGILRRDAVEKGLDFCITHFVGQHFENMSLDFLREMRQKIDWGQVYKAIVYNNYLDLLKSKKKLYREFFKGCEEWDL